MALPLQHFLKIKLTGANDYAGHATPQTQNTFRARDIECALNHTIVNGPRVGVEDLHASLNIENQLTDCAVSSHLVGTRSESIISLP